MKFLIFLQNVLTYIYYKYNEKNIKKYHISIINNIILANFMKIISVD